jgi:methyltransferase of ATP-grasp peptide maturase system
VIDYRSSEGQRRRLADALEAGGHLRTDAWRKAIETVPREIFVPEFFRYRPMTDAPASWEPVVVEVDDNEAALTEIYSDDSLVTQLDGSLRPGDVEVAVTGTPTSSATMPSLVARMWEQLLVDDSNQVLEVGTGSGYSTALGCARLGDHFVTSVDVDSTLTTRAKHALATAGFKPRLAALDAVRSIPEPMGEGYDRVIATCSFRAVPRSWLASSRVDALILVTLTGWLDASALVRLKVTGDGTATGRLMDDPATFMPARTQAAPGISEFSTNAGNDETRPTALSLGVQDEPIHRFLMQLSVPGLQHATSGPDDVPADYFVDIANGSYAQLTDSQVRQRGQLRIWDEVERSIEIWRAAGSPGVDAFQVQIDPTGEFVVLGDHRWRLPVE